MVTTAALWKAPRLFMKDVNFFILKYWFEGQGFSGIFSGNGYWWVPSFCSALLKLLYTCTFFLFVCFLFSGDHLSASASRHHLPCSPAALLNWWMPSFTYPFLFFLLLSLFSPLFFFFFFSKYHLCTPSLLYFSWEVPSLCLLSVTLQSSSLFQREVSKHVWCLSFHAWWISFFSCHSEYTLWLMELDSRGTCISGFHGW